MTICVYYADIPSLDT